jgi:hypothetical protein
MPLRLVLLVTLLLVIVSTVFPWYEATSSVRGSVRGLGSESSSSSMTYVMWAGRPLLALLLLGSAAAAMFFGIKAGKSGGGAAKLGVGSTAAVVLFAILGAIVVPAGASGSSSMAGVGSMSSKIEFAVAWGGIFCVVISVVCLVLAVLLLGGAFVGGSEPAAPASNAE